MTDIFGFYIYAAVIKVALIGGGIISIVLGFRLFMAGIGTGATGDVKADAKQLTLSIANAAPGTCFALFGAAIVASVAWNAAPSYETERKTPGGDEEKVTLRGEASFGTVGEYAAALSNGALTLREAAPLLAGLAGLLVQSGERDAEAKAYAQLALSIDPTNMPAIAAQALALARLRECDDAKAVLQELSAMPAGAARAGEIERAINVACP